MQLIDRALNALEILSQNMNGMSVTDLAEQLGIPASSTHRILSSLKGNHFVVQDEHKNIVLDIRSAQSLPGS